MLEIMKTISLVDECIEKFMKGGLQRHTPRYYGKGAIDEMIESGLFMAQPILTLTEDGIDRAEHLGLVSELKKRSMLAALEQSGVELRRNGAGEGEGVSNVA